jgi:hypothetical protein
VQSEARPQRPTVIPQFSRRPLQMARREPQSRPLRRFFDAQADPVGGRASTLGASLILVMGGVRISYGTFGGIALGYGDVGISLWQTNKQPSIHGHFRHFQPRSCSTRRYLDRSITKPTTIRLACSLPSSRLFVHLCELPTTSSTFTSTVFFPTSV